MQAQLIARQPRPRLLEMAHTRDFGSPRCREDRRCQQVAQVLAEKSPVLIGTKRARAGQVDVKFPMYRQHFMLIMRGAVSLLPT
jgi:hypothetical protein